MSSYKWSIERDKTDPTKYCAEFYKYDNTTLRELFKTPREAIDWITKVWSEEDSLSP